MRGIFVGKMRIVRPLVVVLGAMGVALALGSGVASAETVPQAPTAVAGPQIGHWVEIGIYSDFSCEAQADLQNLGASGTAYCKWFAPIVAGDEALYEFQV
jgi:hypothetical protein